MSENGRSGGVGWAPVVTVWAKGKKRIVTDWPILAQSYKLNSKERRFNTVKADI